MCIPNSMCLELFVQERRQPVLEMVSVEDHIQEVEVLVEIKTNTETVALGMHENVQTILVAQAGRRSPDFF